MIAKVEVERFNLISSRPFDEILAAIKAAIGHPDIVAFAKRTAAAPTFTEFESIVREGLGKTGLMLFMELDHGTVGGALSTDKRDSKFFAARADVHDCGWISNSPLLRLYLSRQTHHPEGDRIHPTVGKVPLHERGDVRSRPDQVMGSGTGCRHRPQDRQRSLLRRD